MFNLGMVKKAVGAPLKIVHAKGISDSSKFELAFQDNKELQSLVAKGKLELLNPVRVMRIFENIRDEVNKVVINQIHIRHFSFI